jgi:acyl-CoA synthetase (AMP-forming)/AMP-acid ligase II
MILCSEEQIREYTGKGWWGKETIADLFFKNAEKTPQEIAVADPPNRAKLTVGEPLRFTYAEMRQTVERLAAGFLELGIKVDDIVMVQLPNVVELACVYLALARIGAVASPLPVQYRTHELRYTMKLTEPKAFVTTANFGGFNYIEMVRGLQPEFPSLKTIIGIGDGLPEGVVSFWDLVSSSRSEKTLENYLTGINLTANDVFTICWTSGTEADPKGVPRSHNHWISIAGVLVEGCEMDPGCNILNPFPFINMASIGGMFVPWLLTGGKFVLHHPLDLQVFLGQIQAEKINYTVVPPALLNMLLQNPAILGALDISSVKTIGSGAAPLSPWMVREYQEKYGIYVINIFGSNEGISLVSGPKDFPDPDERAQYFPRWGVPGYTWKVRMGNQMSTKLVDPKTKEVITEKGVPGEMCIKGPAVFAGYYRRPDLTKKAFDEEGYFNTGDLFAIEGEADNLNRYLFCGRSKDLIIRGGMNISPEELEYLIIEHPKVAEVAVVGYSDEKLGEKVCAVVVPAKGENVSLEEIIEFLKKKDIAVYKLPEKIMVVESLPRNPVGKVLKRELRDLVKGSA